MFKAHRRNTDFQIKSFIEGACHTPDAKWFTLFEQAEERRRVVRQNEIKAKLHAREAANLEASFKKLNEDQTMWSDEDYQIEIKWLEYCDQKPASERMIAAARAELAFIERQMDSLVAETIYVKRYLAGQMSFDQAAQAAQPEEWKRELIFRAQNFLATQGRIPHDHYAAMRRHPEFKQAILPELEKVRGLMLTNDRKAFMELVSTPSIGETTIEREALN